jgi:hypothetical protein
VDLPQHKRANTAEILQLLLPSKESKSYETAIYTVRSFICRIADEQLFKPAAWQGSAAASDSVAGGESLAVICAAAGLGPCSHL